MLVVGVEIVRTGTGRRSPTRSPTRYGAGSGSGSGAASFNYKHSHHQQQQKQYYTNNTAASVSSKSTTTSKQSSTQSQKQDRHSRHHHHYHHSTTQSQKQKQGGPVKEEQLLFEQRLCDGGHGVAVRKIHSNGKSQLRFVKCVPIPNDKLKKWNLYQTNNNNNNNNNDTARTDNTTKNSKNMSYSLPSPSGIELLQHQYQHQHGSSSSSRSVTSLMGRIAGRKHKSNNGSIIVNDDSPKSQMSKRSSSVNGGLGSSVIVNGGVNARFHNKSPNDKMFTKALTWGNKKKVLIPLCKFVAVKKGNTTTRTRRNACDSSRLLSIVTNDASLGCLDIEAPTMLDRDKFAMAFSVFLNVPLEEGLVGESVVVREGEGNGASTSSSVSATGYKHSSENASLHSMGDDMSSLPSTSTYNSRATPHGSQYQTDFGLNAGLLPNLTPSPTSSKGEPKLFDNEGASGSNKLGSNQRNLLGDHHSFQDDHLEHNQTKPIQQSNMFDMGSKLMSKDTPKRSRRNKKGKDNNINMDDDEVSDVSSLTQGFDQEIVEELHQALTELRAELEASRAEAARAVKVAEQAIQSAESCSSNDWNSTVTHKAAEAAAQAQKRSAEAIAKQRQAEEKLATEKKSASFWRRQAQMSEEEVGGLQTRLAVAEVERVTVTGELESEKRKAASYIQTLKRDYSIAEGIQRESLANAAEQNKLLEIELDGTRRDVTVKADEVKLLQDSITEL